MATLTIELPDEVVAHLAQIGHSPKEILLDGILQILAREPELTVTELASRLSLSSRVDVFGDLTQPTISFRERKKRKKEKNLPREEIIRRLLESGFVRKPEEFDNSSAQEWRALPETERQQHIKEMTEMYFPDSPASNYIIRGP